MKGNAMDVGCCYGPISRMYVVRFADQMPTYLKRAAMESLNKRSNFQLQRTPDGAAEQARWAYELR